MSNVSWLQNVADELQKHNYMTGVERTVDRVKATGEVFTPTDLVLEMCAYLGVDVFAPGQTVLDPACGDGQFLVAAKAIKVHVHGMTEKAALADVYGVDIMRDNVDLCRRRLGGGTIIMGNTLNPSQALPGQTPEELELMVALFEQPQPGGARRKKPRVAKLTRVEDALRVERTPELALF